MTTLQDIVEYGPRIITIASIVHNILPPYDWNPEFISVGFSDFPLVQKYFHKFFNNRWYKVLVYISGYIAINARSTIWKSISVNNPTGPNANLPSLISLKNEPPKEVVKP